ncbi:MAG: DNA polymerase III subunit alpha [Deltaproteobacteria bacterium]|nr:DNA polymerase III subunit alpha [Deltaproteobacteria bacterium]
MSNFVHLHLHTQYSLLDGAIRLAKLFPRLAELKMDTVAITDHGNMFGAIDFYQRAKSAGIKPIIGCEVYVAGKQGMLDRSSREMYHLVLLARNEEGYRNLCQLVSRAYLDGFYYHPRMDKQLLKKYSSGLTALTACLSGELATHIKRGQVDAARQSARDYAAIFEPGQFFLELQHNGLVEQEKVNEVLVKIAAEENLPLVATNDCHYLNKGDHRAHDILLCISTGKTVDDPNRMRHDTQDLYLRSTAEMEELFADQPEALENTRRIADSCNLELNLSDVFLPHYQVPEGYDLDSFMEIQTKEGLEKHIQNMETAEQEKYRQRLDYEIDVIKRMGFSGYFLIVWDFIAFSKKNGIPVGPGRGSGAGSLVAFCLEITAIDPLPYDLLFERFLNPDRVSMPDFDIDFCQDRRNEVITYVSEKYGSDRVAQIITFGQLKPRLAIKDVGRVMGLSFGEADRISKLIPLGPNVTLDQALKEEPRLTEIQDEKPIYREVVQVARSLEGLNRHFGTHAAGIVISDKPLLETVPVLKGEDGFLTTQYAKDEVEKAGLVKFDFLGLKTLTVIDHALKMIRQSGGELEILDIALDDQKVFELLISGETDGIFQIESDGFKQLMKELRPDRFEDIIAAVALYRPGPLNSGMVEDYINRKQRGKLITYPHPVVEPVLLETYGVIIYQEQVMRIATELCGFSMGQADVLRKAMGKKNADQMARQKQLFIDGAVQKSGMPKSEATDLFEKIEKFAEYAFNKSHSAAYALISYQTAYLKAHYPVEFMAALLSSEMNNTEKMVRHIAKVREMGIEILPPDVNRSERTFSVEHGKILFGLGAVKGLGDAAIEVICQARSKLPFSTLFDFCLRLDLRKVNKRLVEVLIKSGAMDGFKASRASLCAVIELAFSRAHARLKEKLSGQRNLLEMMNGPDDAGGIADEPPLPNLPEWPERQRLALEREALGFCLTGHPLDRYKKLISRLSSCTSRSLNTMTKKEVTLAALVAGMRERPLKNGTGRMAALTLEDLEGTCEAIVFSKEFAEYEKLLKSEEPLLLIGSVAMEGDDNSEARLRVREVRMLSDAHVQKTSRVHFKVNAEKVTPEQLQQLKTILGRFKGSCKAYLHMRMPDTGPETVLKLHEEVGASEKMEHEVDTLFNSKVTEYS